MQSIEILSINKSNQNEIFNDLAIPISYFVNKNKYSNLPNYLYTDNNNYISDQNINQLISLVNMNKSFLKNNLTKKNKILKEDKNKTKKL